MTTGARANSQHVAIGLCIVLLGVFLGLDRLGIVPASQTLRYWPFGLVLLGLGVIIEAFRGNGAQVRSSVPWGAVLLIVIIGGVGSRVYERRVSAAPDSSESLSVFAVLGGSERMAGPEFTSADITTVMGGARLDLRNTKPAPGKELVVDVFNLMGGSVIYAPRDWQLDIRAVSIMGGVSDKRDDDGQRRRRRGGFDGGVDVDLNVGFGDAPPGEPAAPAAPEAPAPVTAQPPAAPVEAETPPADDGTARPVRLVIRGYVAMGGLVIKSL